MIKHYCKKILSYKVCQQLLKYGVVGCSAAFTQYSVVVLLVQLFDFHPLWANPFGFACGFLVSFLGHRFFTFHTSKRKLHALFMHFSFLAFCNFLLNQMLFYIFLTDFKMHYAIALPIVIAISTSVVFTLNNLWVFKT